MGWAEQYSVLHGIVVDQEASINEEHVYLSCWRTAGNERRVRIRVGERCEVADGWRETCSG